MDYQNGIVGMLGEPDELLSRAADAIATVRRAGAHVGYVRVAFEDADFEAIPPTSRMGARVGASARRVPQRLSDHRGPRPGRAGGRTTSSSARSASAPSRPPTSTPQLRERGVDTLILAGISTSGVVLSTVRDASDRDYRVLVLADATADPEPEVHAFLTERIFPRQADVITVAELEGLLSGGG